MGKSRRRGCFQDFTTGRARKLTRTKPRMTRCARKRSHTTAMRVLPAPLPSETENAVAQPPLKAQLVNASGRIGPRAPGPLRGSRRSNPRRPMLFCAGRARPQRGPQLPHRAGLPPRSGWTAPSFGPRWTRETRTREEAHERAQERGGVARLSSMGCATVLTDPWPPEHKFTSSCALPLSISWRSSAMFALLRPRRRPGWRRLPAARQRQRGGLAGGKKRPQPAPCDGTQPAEEPGGAPQDVSSVEPPPRPPLRLRPRPPRPQGRSSRARKTTCAQARSHMVTTSSSSISMWGRRSGRFIHSHGWRCGRRRRLVSGRSSLKPRRRSANLHPLRRLSVSPTAASTPCRGGRSASPPVLIPTAPAAASAGAHDRMANKRSASTWR